MQAAADHRHGTGIDAFEGHQVLHAAVPFHIIQVHRHQLQHAPAPLQGICQHASQQENQLKLYIADNGVGIDSKDIRRIFQKGFTGNNRLHNEKATGIGLYLCRKLCEKLYLDIDVESVLHQGTTMIITFPLSNLLLLK